MVPKNKRLKLLITFLVLVSILTPSMVQAGRLHFGIIDAIETKLDELKEKVKEKREEERREEERREEEQEEYLYYEVEPAENTNVLTKETMKHFIKQEDTTYYFDKEATQIGELKEGDIIISTEGEGFLRKITAISSSDNQWVVETTDTTLVEAFEKVYIKLRERLTVDEISSQKALWLKEGVVLQETPSAAGEITVSLDTTIYDGPGDMDVKVCGKMTFLPTIEFEIKIDIDWLTWEPELKYLRFQVENKVTTEIEVIASLKGEWKPEPVELGTIKFGVITAGPIPLFPELSIIVGCEGDFECEVTTGITHKTSFSAGMEYNNGNWSEISSSPKESKFEYTPPSLSSEVVGSLKGYAGPKLVIKVGALVGPYITPNGYLRLNVTKSLGSDFRWCLFRGLEVKAGIDAEIIGIDLDPITLITWEHDKRVCDTIAPSNQPPTISSLTADPTAVPAGGTSTITCTASDPDGDPLTYSWSATGGTISGSGSQVTWTAPQTIGTYTIICTVSDGKGGTAEESVDVTTGNQPPTISLLTAEPQTILPGGTSTITCTASDPDGDPLTYSWSATGGTISGSGSQVTWSAPQTIGFYIITCTVSDGKGGTDQENVGVSVAQNNPPFPPKDPSPQDGATNQPINVDLSWTGGDPDPGDTVTYDVYFEANDSTPDELVSPDQSATTYDPGTLGYNTHYYWRIVAKDNHNATTHGPVWDFYTGESTAGTIQLPKTGQTTSYAPGDDGDLQMGVAWPSPRFTDNGDETVTDNLTGLMWTKDANMAGAMSWSDAISYCNNLNYAGYSDWRLPNINELKSLIDAGRYNPALPEDHPFTNVQLSNYWSSTGISSHDACAVHMWNGFVQLNLMRGSWYVWPVRAGGGGTVQLPKTGQTTSYAPGDDGDLQRGIAWPDPRFTDHGDGTVTDNLTGLMWTKDANMAGAMSWSDAISYCNNLNYAGYSDWRLPNRKELRSLLDYGPYNVGPPEDAPFTNVQSAYYWSSTTYAYNTDYAWSVAMWGYVIWFYKSSSYYVWPVRAGQ
jgi:hypothetical protein